MPVPAKFRDFDLDAFLKSDDVRAFIGPGFDFFDVLWRADFARKENMEKVLSSFHWNGLAILVSPITWFAYRKMYDMAALFLALVLCASVVIDILNIQVGVAPFVGAFVVVGLISYNVYFLHVHKAMMKIRAMPEERRAAAIAARGGVSVLAAILFTAFALVLFVGYSYVLFARAQGMM